MILINTLTVIILLFGGTAVTFLLRDVWDKKTKDGTAQIAALICMVFIGAAAAMAIEMNIEHYSKVTICSQ